MKRRLIALLAGLGVAFIAALVVPAQASATPSHGIEGEFCSAAEHGTYKMDHDKWYQCVEDPNGTHWRWHLATSPAPTIKPTPTATPSVSTSAGSTGNLPVTGPKSAVIAGVGVALGIGGATALWFGRRRRKVHFKS